MNKRTYNLIYAIYFWCFGPDEEYEDANLGEYEKYAIGMLEEIQEYLPRLDNDIEKMARRD